ncbi:hypothetical protein B0H14DRAFT_2556067 [Mycena olivaceomarginata]|nr:hypothetical protein B0H14DRAFT_2556067 [Mycena olivaceomarginata]
MCCEWAKLRARKSGSGFGGREELSSRSDGVLELRVLSERKVTQRWAAREKIYLTARGSSATCLPLKKTPDLGENTAGIDKNFQAPGFGFTFFKPKPKPFEEGLAWLGFGLSRLASNFPQCICYTFIAALLLPMQKMQLNPWLSPLSLSFGHPKPEPKPARSRGFGLAWLVKPRLGLRGFAA